MSDLSRVEQLLRNALGEDIYEVTPQSRVEALLVELNELIEGMGGSVSPEDIATAVAAYLDEHLTNPTNPPVDTSLSISGAAADAKKTGDELSDLKEDFTEFAREISDVTLTKEVASVNTITGRRVSVSITYNTIGLAAENSFSVKTFPVVAGETYRAYGFGYDRNSFYMGGISTEEDIAPVRTVQQILLCGTDAYPSGFTYHCVEFVAQTNGFLHLTYKDAQSEAKLYSAEYKPKQAVDLKFVVIKNGDEYNCLSHEYGNVYKSRVFKHCNANNLFQLYRIGCGSFDGTSYTETTSFATYTTDIVGPASVGRWNSSTGSENGRWIGGNHSMTIDGVACRTAEETLFMAYVNGTDITNADNGVYLGKGTFYAENDLYFAQTISGNTFDGATKAIHETRRYMIGNDMDVKVELGILYDDVSFVVYYGMQNVVSRVIDEIGHPTMMTDYTDMTATVKFLNESKTFYLNRNDGWHFDMILDDVGLANREQIRIDGAYFGQYGYGQLSNGKIYQTLVQGKHYPSGTKLMWSGKYKFYHD